MGDRKKKTHKDGRNPVVFFFRYPFGVFPPSVRRAYDGYASEMEGSLELFSKGQFLKMVLYVLFYFFRGSEAVAYLVCLWAHKVSTKPIRGRCSLSWTATD